MSPRQFSPAKDAAACEQVRAALRRPDEAGPIPPSTWIEVLKRLAQVGDPVPLEHRPPGRWPARYRRARPGSSARRAHPQQVCGLNAANAQLVLATTRSRCAGVVDHLDVEHHAAPPRATCRMWRAGLSTIRWQSRPAALVDRRRDRLGHDRPDRDRLDEVAVADVVMEDPLPRPGGRRSARPAARSRPRTARLGFDRTDPLAPAPRRS